MKDILQKSFKFAFPFTIISKQNIVKLVAGEDYRYTLTGANLDSWLPSLLAKIDGNKLTKEILENFDEPLKEQALAILERLYGERVLIENVVLKIATKENYKLEIFGSGKVFELLQNLAEKDFNKDSKNIIKILCQDRLDYQQILTFNQQRLMENSLFLWVSYGAMTRGFVSPIFFPNIGACLACLISQFKQLSPTPEIYQELIEQAPKSIKAVNFPDYGVKMLEQLVLWKLSFLQETELPASIYRLHVLEISSLEISSHQVFIAPDCPGCRQGV
ncbi:MAG: hypothetical protein IPK14_19225 [Blastocatellia bacterium]|nr:hypothetical protein [Blastocatellia bacterium]MBL8196060.1 hypothetical protein [Blastocatellia bacterium]MBN8725517.1 hypothetical protein [Acidobacteriota bacterium]